ncbi:MAG: DUF1990 family protein [Candidatus Korobacteraceae bacterium]
MAMLRLTRPSEEELLGFLAAQRTSHFSYNSVGATADLNAPSGFLADRYQVRLGNGQAVWERAVKALDDWEMFNLGWFSARASEARLQPGTNVVVSGTHFGFYSMNACRVVYLIRENGSEKKHGFAYGTLLDHAESGEERFCVTWNPRDESVWYEIFAFSRPSQLLPKLAYPLTRMLQRRFARDSKAAMLRAANRH